MARSAGGGPSRRAVVAAGAAALLGLSLSACRLGPPPPGPVTLGLEDEPLPPAALRRAFAALHPDTRLAFGPKTRPSLTGLRASALGAAVTRPLLPLAGLLDLAGFAPVDVDPATWSAFAVGGVPVGMPMARSRLVVLFDRAALEAAGRRDPRPDWTWDDLLALGEVLAIRSRAAPLARWDADVAQGVWTTLWAGFGATLVAADGRFVPRADPRALEALSAFARLAALVSAQPWGAPGARPALALRQFVLQAEVDAWRRSGLAVGVAPFPRLPRRAAVPAAAWGHGVLRAGPARGAALQFLVWSAGFDGQRFVRSLGLIPVLRSMAALPPALQAPAGVEAGALTPSPTEDLYPPAALRQVPHAAAAFAATVGRLRGPIARATAAAAYAAGAAAANRALAAAGFRGGGPWPPVAAPSGR
jgi:ABC-type glycerol-3-phosphate transport system substrate-binding protein